MSRIASVLAPEVLRAVERVATNRATRREMVPRFQQQVPAEAIQFSEVEIDVSVPFVQKITMRNAIAWSSAIQSVALPEEAKPKRSSLKRAGLLGIGGATALAAGILARKTLPQAGRSGRIIDVTGSSRHES